ncbi:MAG: hypothetical protein WHV67_04330 [Thermoanaerobaculia bacterium]
MFDLIMSLKKYEELEEELSKFYLWLSEIFLTDEEVSKFFSKLYIEEQQHKSMVLYQMRLIKTNPIHFRTISLDGCLVRKTLDYLKRFISQKNTLSLEEALKTSLLLEACTMESYFTNAFEEVSPEIAKLSRSMQKESQNHFDKIRNFMLKRGMEIPDLPESKIENKLLLEKELDNCFQNI